jgi:hypothetical protein
MLLTVFSVNLFIQPSQFEMRDFSSEDSAGVSNDIVNFFAQLEINDAQVLFEIRYDSFGKFRYPLR